MTKVIVGDDLMRRINDRAYAVANDTDVELSEEDLAVLAMDGLSSPELAGLIVAHGHQAVILTVVKRLSF